jgi:hypothetical protein
MSTHVHLWQPLKRIEREVTHGIIFLERCLSVKKKNISVTKKWRRELRVCLSRIVSYLNFRSDESFLASSRAQFCNKAAVVRRRTNSTKLSSGEDPILQNSSEALRSWGTAFFYAATAFGDRRRRSSASHWRSARKHLFSSARSYRIYVYGSRARSI